MVRACAPHMNEHLLFVAGWAVLTCRCSWLCWSAASPRGEDISKVRLIADYMRLEGANLFSELSRWFVLCL